MEVRGLHHVNVNVRDLTEALDFYVQGLGFEQFHRPEMAVRGGWLRMGAHELHIMEVANIVPDKKQHFALLVNSVDDACKELDEKGISFRRITNTDGRSDQLFLHDPTGNRIEIQE
jgi:catechol 2,3-dioxygenase-like lactoylglutathione lyase family enzyme